MQSSVASPVVAATARPQTQAAAKSTRIASIDWMRGFVMVLMIMDHASMAYDQGRLDEDSAMFPGS